VTHPAVYDAIVVGVPDDRWVNRVAAVVSLAEGAVATPDELIAYVGQHLADHKRPRQLVVVPEVERTPSGKANRSWARELLERLGSQATDAEPV
jgi:fatty-acyl-CoA synthase